MHHVPAVFAGYRLRADHVQQIIDHRSAASNLHAKSSGEAQSNDMCLVAASKAVENGHVLRRSEETCVSG